MEPTEIQAARDALKKLLEHLPAGTNIDGLSAQEIIAILKEVCAVAGVICPLIEHL